jgi:hypothetical protein
MTTLTQAQADILAAAAQGDVEATPETKKAATALIKRGFLISVPVVDALSRLMITTEGRAALTPDSPSEAEAAGEPDTEASADLGAAPGTIRRLGNPLPRRPLAKSPRARSRSCSRSCAVPRVRA